MRTKQKGINKKQMSKLHWKLRSKGKTYTQALKITGKAKELSKKLMNNKWKKGKFGKYSQYDFDGDGKVNKYDCYPFDNKRQDDPVRSWKEIKKENEEIKFDNEQEKIRKEIKRIKEETKEDRKSEARINAKERKGTWDDQIYDREERKKQQRKEFEDKYFPKTGF